MPDLAVAALVAAVFSTIAVRIAAMPGLSWWALDRPNERSLHTRLTPRTGGLGLFAAAALTWLLLGNGALAVVLSLAALLLVPSLIDDAVHLPVVARFALQAVAASAFLMIAGAPLWLLPLLLIGLVWSTNLYNFMDGSDGLAGGMALFGFAGYALHAATTAPDIAIVGAILAGAAAGFLVWNWPPARIFMGDSGSIPLGFLAGAIGILGWLREVWPPTLPLLLFAPFAIDATLTLLRRLLRRENVLKAHRAHLYQQLILSGWSHRSLIVAAYLLMFAIAAVTLMLRAFSFEAQMVISIAGLLGLAMAHQILIHRVEFEASTREEGRVAAPSSD